MIYNTNEDVRALLKQAAAEEGITFTGLAGRCGLSPQSMNNRMNKKHISLDDIKTFAEAMGMDLYIALVPKKPDGNQ